MKRRIVSKTNNEVARVNHLGSSLRRDVTTKSSVHARVPVKKSTKKRSAKSAASSILGLKSTPIDEVSGESTRWSSDNNVSSVVDHVAECQRLREHLERVLVDHQRQEEEFVALRALAKSLKDEVEMIQEQRQYSRLTCNSSEGGRGTRPESHEFFKLDVQNEKLEGENVELRRQLKEAQEELKRVRASIAERLPVYKLAAVKANAELRCVKSQLQQERVHSDRLQKQLVRCKSRQDDVLIRASSKRGGDQEDYGNDVLRDSEVFRRERAAFFRQCMRSQDGWVSPCHGIKNNTAELNEPMNCVNTRTDKVTDFELALRLKPSLEAASTTETSKPVYEDLLGLDLYLGELDFKPDNTSKSV
ncbi:unnamed protein product [Phytophthora lilii]|uniref:Unnamed protein product n=1 Tax=Phytophthora lilii TaxID=2077276 RepID=A0A9W6X2G8_9STRA|nr:unnamed protein product [Phytophthora lilii]